MVVYIVNPFSSSSREESFPSYVGLLRCIADIMPDLSESNKKNVIFQVQSTIIIVSLCVHTVLFHFLLVKGLHVCILQEWFFVDVAWPSGLGHWI